jgi:hypothetical protein
MKIKKQTTYSYPLGLSLDTHTDDVLAVFQNGAKSLFLFTKCKQTWKSKEKNIFLLPRPRPFIRYPYWWPFSLFLKMVPNRCLCLRNVNKHKNWKINNIFLLPSPRPFIWYPYWWPFSVFSKWCQIAPFVYIHKK